jgi:hypothetical protein
LSCIEPFYKTIQTLQGMMTKVQSTRSVLDAGDVLIKVNEIIQQKNYPKQFNKGLLQVQRKLKNLTGLMTHHADNEKIFWECMAIKNKITVLFALKYPSLTYPNPCSNPFDVFVEGCKNGQIGGAADILRKKDSVNPYFCCVSNRTKAWKDALEDIDLERVELLIKAGCADFAIICHSDLYYMMREGGKKFSKNLLQLCIDEGLDISHLHEFEEVGKWSYIHIACDLGRNDLVECFIYNATTTAWFLSGCLPIEEMAKESGTWNTLVKATDNRNAMLGKMTEDLFRGALKAPPTAALPLGLIHIIEEYGALTVEELDEDQRAELLKRCNSIVI